MTRRSSSRTRRQRTLQQSRTALRRESLLPAMRRFAHVGGLPAFPWVAATLMLLVGCGAWLSAAGLAHGVAEASDRPLAFGRASPPSHVPDVVHWEDPAHQTAYAVRLNTAEAHLAGEFLFTLPNGDEIRGTVPLQLQPDGIPMQQANSTLGSCTSGALATVRLKSSAAAVTHVDQISGAAGRTYVSSVVFALTARIGAQGLVAFAGLSYAGAEDAAGVSRVCSPGSFDYQMQAGCTALACTDPLATAGPTVGKHNDAVMHASMANNVDGWKAVYAMSAQSVKGQYSDVGFANALMAQQTAKGKITHISPIASPPAVQYDAAGQAYFTATQDVTVDRNGTTTTQHVTAYYVLESGLWHFWFSA
ncbi:MAG TPA: hypothetical protein VF916_00550 [Ktedonobacterales bacterium]